VVDCLRTLGGLPTNVAFGLPGKKETLRNEYQLGQFEVFPVETDGCFGSSSRTKDAMSRRLEYLFLTTVFSIAPALAQPIKLHPANPHYFLFNGRPTILITSAEHYGAVVNKDFDYVPYLDTLQSYGMNYTRIYMGAMFEPQGKFIKGNPLGPKPWSLVVPWARSNQPGYLFGGNKFDLDKWNPEYF